MSFSFGFITNHIIMYSEVNPLKIQSFDYKIERRILSKPLPVFGKSISERELLIITINGKQTEVALLPGLHSESYDDVISEFKNFTQKPQNIHAIKSPALQFALNALFLDETQNEFNFNEHSFISDLNKIPLHLSQSMIKVKISPDIIETSFYLLEDLLKENPARKFRLDANQSFNEEQLQNLNKKLLKYLTQIDYIEEPTRDLNLWNNLKLPYYLALDESLKDSPPNLLAHNFKILIMRPSTQSIKTSLQWIDYAFMHDMKIVIGSCYEGRIGIKNLINFISSAKNVFSHYQGIGFHLN